MSDSAGLVEIGFVARSHGVKGAFYVYKPVAPELIAVGKRVFLEGQARQITSVAGTVAKPIVKLEGIETPEEVKALSREPLQVPTDELPPLEEDQWYAKDLVGLKVLDADNDEALLGEVVALVNAPSADLIEVEPTAGGATFYVPLVDDAVAEMSPENGRVRVHGTFLALDI